MSPRPARLSHDRVMAGALALADRIGAEALTLRKLADSLGVSPMAIYHHVSDKEAILDGMVEGVFLEIVLPDSPAGWREALEERCRATRRVLARHPWAIGLLDTRTHPGPATLGHHDWVVAQLRSAGFSLPLTAHAFALVDSFLYGFAQQEAALPFPSDAPPPRELVEAMLSGPAAEAFPHLTELARVYTLDETYSFGAEFEWGLACVLDGLETALAHERSEPSPGQALGSNSAATRSSTSLPAGSPIVTRAPSVP